MLIPRQGLTPALKAVFSQEENFTEAVEASRRALAPIDIRTPLPYTGPTDAGPPEVIVHDATEVGLKISELTCISVSCS